MKKEKTSFSLVNLLKTVFKAKPSTQKDTKPKRQPRWMYRND